MPVQVWCWLGFRLEQGRGKLCFGWCKGLVFLSGTSSFLAGISIPIYRTWRWCLESLTGSESWPLTHQRCISIIGNKPTTRYYKTKVFKFNGPISLYWCCRDYMGDHWQEPCWDVVQCEGCVFCLVWLCKLWLNFFFRMMDYWI